MDKFSIPPQSEAQDTTTKIVETAAAMTQDMGPVKHICAHLNAFHASTGDETPRCVEANHYCSKVTDEIRQCILYDSPHPNARLIGVEYMISPRLYATLPQSERALWHSHVYEVTSGILIMPKPPLVPSALWDAAEKKEMESLITLYGKVYHTWQTDLGHEVPLGEPKLMTSFTRDEQMVLGESKVRERDERFGCDTEGKRRERRDMEVPSVHPDADSAWKKN